MANELILWGRANSANVQKALWILEETGLTYKRIDVGGKYGGTDTPEYGAMNPNRLVPVLQDGDLTLWESSAIVRYICAEYGKEAFWPERPADRAIVDQWADWAIGTFQPAWFGVFSAIVRTPKSQHDPRVIAAALERAVDRFRIVDARLAETPYLAGDRLSYADIFAGVSQYRWTTLDIDRPSLPHVEAWHQRLLDRPAFVKTVNVSYADLVAPDVA